VTGHQVRAVPLSARMYGTYIQYIQVSQRREGTRFSIARRDVVRSSRSNPFDDKAGELFYKNCS